MKKLFILMLAVLLAACSTPAPAPTEAVAPAPAQPVVVTVVVEPTQAPAQPTPVPPEPVVVTVVVEPTQAPAAAQPAPTEVPAQPAAASDVIALDNALGRGVFTNMTMSSNNVTLRCYPRDITFNITTPNTAIRDVIFYYRMADLDRLYPSEWKAFGKMNNNGGGNFTLTFKGEDVHPDLRIDGGWLDVQFVGLAKSGDRVDSSDKIESMIKYTFDCP